MEQREVDIHGSEEEEDAEEITMATKLLTGKALDKTISFESFRVPGKFLFTQDPAEGETARKATFKAFTNEDEYLKHSTFFVRSGLDGDATHVSFESITEKGSFLYLTTDGLLELQSQQQTDEFSKGASFQFVISDSFAEGLFIAAGQDKNLVLSYVSLPEEEEAPAEGEA